MAQQKAEPPPPKALPYENLAQCLQQERANRRWTREQLAEKAAMPLALLQELEEGRQVFLAVAHRQRLARVLRLYPYQLEALEKPDAGTPPPEDTSTTQAKETALNLIRQTHRCPECQATVRIKQFRRSDMHGHGVTMVQYTCTQCLFRHRIETEDDLWQA